jgi:hypothetical protein
MWRFALWNWRWLVPTALCLAFGVYGGFEHMKVLTLERNVATGQLVAEKAVNDAKTADAARTAQLEVDHAAEMRTLQEKANVQQIAIASAPHTDTCLHTDAARTFLGGLPSSDKARSGQPRRAADVNPGLPL